MKVALINHSDCRGGAAVVCLRLTRALNELGIEATMVVGRKETSSPLVVQGSALRRNLSFMAEHLDILINNSFSRKNLFKLSTARFGMGLHKLPAVKNADIVVLNWVNQGTMSLHEIEQISRMRKPIVWIMHDRWCATGLCHHVPDNCTRLSSRCGCCPMLHSHDNYTDLSRVVFTNKLRLYSKLVWPQIEFVAISHWLERVSAGGLIPGCKVIPNAFPTCDYPPHPTMSRRQLGLPEDNLPLVVMGAARLDDPIKNLPLAIDAINAMQCRATAVFFGAINDPSLLERIKKPYVWLGPVNDSNRVAQIMAHATVVMSSSTFETLPTTLIEGMSAGATIVTTGNGGQDDIVDEGVTGYICPDNSAATLSMLLDRAVYAPFNREKQHRACCERFDSLKVAHQYIELFNNLLSNSADFYRLLDKHVE